MGYTHYFTRTDKFYDPKNDLFTHFALGVSQLISTATQQGLRVADGGGEILDGWRIDKEYISFNGYGPESHETFFWPANDKNEEYFFHTFCKTAHKPYDRLVTAALILAKKIYGDMISVGSDGSWADWSEGAALYTKVFGEPALCPWGDQLMYAIDDLEERIDSLLRQPE